MPTEMNYLTTTELLAREWTRTLIKRFLPKPDGWVAVKHFRNHRGQDTYAMIKIWNIEQSAEFEAAFLRSWKRRTQDVAPQEKLLALRSETPPHRSVRTKEQVQMETTLAAAAGEIMQARARGYRTPHKC